MTFFNLPYVVISDRDPDMPLRRCPTCGCDSLAFYPNAALDSRGVTRMPPIGFCGRCANP